ncbi:MAG: DUF2635 domain-containing protein [Roseomonas sp.]|nr:DUF2635 domain-containing protein [Roseomonas sp.]
MFVKPAHPDLLVANPEARPPMPRHLPAEGAEVPDSQYWRRRIADGDVVLAPAPEPQTKRRTGEKE